MLLKVGVATVAISLMLAAGVVAIGLQGETYETAISTESRAAAEPPPVQVREFDLGQRLEIDNKADGDEEVSERGDGNADDAIPRDRVQVAGEAVPEEEPEPASPPAPRPRVKSALTPEPVPDWPEPTSEQVTSAQEPRYYHSQPDADMTLSVEALGLYDVPVLSTASLEALDRGLMHEPETSLPWDGGAQRNVFIAGHYLGWPGTASHLVFYNLDKLRRRDEIVLKDKQGRAYVYRVS